MLRRALVASTVGSAIDAYDFLLYSTAAGLVFGQVFFPETGPTTGLLLAFGTCAVGFLSRPIGAALFGYFEHWHALHHVGWPVGIGRNADQILGQPQQVLDLRGGGMQRDDPHPWSVERDGRGSTLKCQRTWR